MLTLVVALSPLLSNQPHCDASSLEELQRETGEEDKRERYEEEERDGEGENRDGMERGREGKRNLRI